MNVVVDVVIREHNGEGEEDPLVDVIERYDGHGGATDARSEELELG